MPAGDKGWLGMAPTAAEVQHAKEILDRSQDPKKKERAVLASFRYYLIEKGGGTTNPGLLQDVMASKGEERKQYLLDFLVMQARDKKAKVGQTSTYKTGTDKRSHTITGWVSWKKFCDVLGEKKAELFLEKNVVTTRPCTQTGSTEKEIQEYYLKESYTDLQGMEVSTSSINHVKDDADDADLLMMVTDCKKNTQALESIKYTSELQGDYKKLTPKITRMVKLVEALIVDPDADKGRDTIDKMTKTFDAIVDEFGKVEEAAKRFGVQTSGPKKRKR
ncbi:unnamed protein product [Prorocentrum cordatum]|uniref:Uncharacterized protein n=1 Tax=Prorocentrum cordatum TaxID=2364126 RepID=A0ABN9QHI8_9DINO|nr:unnamed protein product [Polarella glacialis]